MIIMGFLGKIGNAIQKIDYHISNDPEIVGYNGQLRHSVDIGYGKPVKGHSRILLEEY